MREVVKTHLPGEDAPIEWAVTADGVLYTAQIPIYPDGKIETGDIEKQADLTFDNLKKTVEAAGGKVVAAAALVDRTGGEVDLGVPFFPLVEINFPTYAADEVPPELAAKPVDKPGSRKD